MQIEGKDSAPPADGQTPADDVETRFVEDRSEWASQMLRGAFSSHPEFRRELKRHRARMGRIRSTMAPGPEQDAALNAEEDRHMKAARGMRLWSVADVIAAIEVERKHLDQDQGTMHKHRRHLLDRAHILLKTLQRVAPLALKRIYTMSDRTAELLAAEVARIETENAKRSPKDDAKFTMALLEVWRTLDKKDQRRTLDNLGLWKVIWHANGALRSIANDDRDYEQIERFHRKEIIWARAQRSHLPGDDAELFTLWHAYVKARDELNAHKGENEEADRLCDIFRKAEMAFVTAPAHTVAGVALKFQFIAWERSQDPHLMDDLPDDIEGALKTGTEAIERLAAYSSAAMSAEQTSTIPVLGMTFRQAADRVREQLEWVERSADQDPDDSGPEKEQREATSDERRHLNKVIMTTPAQTLGDVLVKLERLACPYTGAAVFEIEEDEITTIADDLRRIADRVALPVAGPVAAPTSDADAFADAIAAFEAEAPGPLALPQSPTPAMAEAGAAAVGITPDQFRAAYSAAAQAFEQEKAA